MPTIVVAGSRKLPPGAAPRLLVRFLANVSQRYPDAVVALRSPREKAPSTFEVQAAEVAELLGLAVEWYAPEPAVDPVTNVPVRGREQTFARDLILIQKADLVLCFWDHTETGDEHSGTVGLADKAVEFEKPVYAYSMDGDQLERVGEFDRQDEWIAMVPQG